MPDKRKYRNALRQLRLLAELSEHEKILYARSLAATPDERWKMIVHVPGPHGIPLIVHAEKGGPPAAAVREFLRLLVES